MLQYYRDLPGDAGCGSTQGLCVAQIGGLQVLHERVAGKSQGGLLFFVCMFWMRSGNARIILAAQPAFSLAALRHEPGCTARKEL
ncbi:hypothetical protein D3C81_1483330 [compost metagenome]